MRGSFSPPTARCLQPFFPQSNYRSRVFKDFYQFFLLWHQLSHASKFFKHPWKTITFKTKQLLDITKWSKREKFISYHYLAVQLLSYLRGINLQKTCCFICETSKPFFSKKKREQVKTTEFWQLLSWYPSKGWSSSLQSLLPNLVFSVSLSLASPFHLTNN